MHRFAWILAAFLVSSMADGQSRPGPSVWRSTGLKGLINAITVDSSTNRIYAIDDDLPTNTLWISEDDGQTWSKLVVNQGFAAYVRAVAVTGSASGTVYVGTAGCNPRPPLACYGQVLKAMDEISPWRILPTPSGAAVSAIGISPSRPEIVYVAGYDWGEYFGFRSSDGGETWTTLLNSFAGTTRTILVDATDPAVVYGGGDSGLRKSADAGASWSPGNLAASPVWALVQDAATGTIYAGTGRGLYATQDGGATWRLIGFAGEGVRALALDTASGRLYAATDADGVQVTQDGGGEWSEVGTGLPQVPILGLALFKSSVLFASPYFGGIYRVQLHGSRSVTFR